jgi:hypothetical protein
MTNPNPAAPRLYEADPTGLYAALRPFLQPDGSGYVVPFEAVASIGLSLAASRAAVLVALEGADQYDRAELAEVVAAIRSVLSVTPDTAEGAGMHRMGEYVIDKIAALQGARLRAALASGTGEPGLDVDLLARALRVVTRGSWSTPARRDPERQKRQDEAWLTRTAGAIAREYVALQGADPAYANDKGADPTPEPK